MDKFYLAMFYSGLQKLSEEKFRIIPGQSILVGNMRGQADIKVSSDSVSRKHLYIAMDGEGGLMVCDAGSSNGSFVGNQRLETNTWRSISSSDTIFLGREVTCEIHEEDSTIKQLPPIPPSAKKLKDDIDYDDSDEYGSDDVDKKRDPRININFEPNIQVPNHGNAGDKNPVSLSGLILVGALICAALTNPSKQDHLNAIADKFPNNLSYLEEAKEDRYKNFIFCSAVVISPQIVSFGIFKNIIFVNPENFDKNK
jgi:hypothetical protein